MPEMRVGSCSEAVRLILGAHNTLYESYNAIDVFLDVDHANPTESERAVYEIACKVLQEAERAIADLATYGAGAMRDVKQSIENPHDPNIQQRTLAVLKEFFERIRKYYEVAQKIRQVVPSLLWNLCCGPLPPAEQIERTQALCLQFARIIDFVHRFDAIKMQTPAVMNDISFYRRMMMRSDTCDTDNASIEQANDILMFFSDATPMLKCLVDATGDFVRESDLSLSNTTDTLATFVYICRHMLERKMNSERISPETQNFFTRVMIGAFILYDHTDHHGAFCRQSPIDVRAIVAVVKANEKEAERLLNALKYTTKHFNDPTTPKAIKSLLN